MSDKCWCCDHADYLVPFLQVIPSVHQNLRNVSEILNYGNFEDFYVGNLGGFYKESKRHFMALLLAKLNQTCASASSFQDCVPEHEVVMLFYMIIGICYILPDFMHQVRNIHGKTCNLESVLKSQSKKSPSLLKNEIKEKNYCQKQFQECCSRDLNGFF